MNRRRVIIVGAGPAGCAAAYDLVTAGHDVQLLDRKDFPRLKPCAGALTIKALNRLRYSIAPVIRFVAEDLNVSLYGRRRRLFHGSGPICAMTVREEFDAFCLKQTIAAGAAFTRIADIKEITETAKGVTLRSGDGHSFEGDYLIGADGANSQVRRMTNAFPMIRTAIALEGQVSRTTYSGKVDMQFDFGQVKGGYGWLFPKHDHINVGLYTQREGVRFGKAELVKYCEDTLGVSDIEHMVGYPIGIGGHNYVPRKDRVMLVGDAAGLTDPLLGEGIHNAIKSGQAVAAAIMAASEGKGEAHHLFRNLLNEVQLDLRSCRYSATLFYDLLLLSYGALVAPPARLALMRGFAAGMTFRDIIHSFPLASRYKIASLPAIEEFYRSAAASTPT